MSLAFLIKELTELHDWMSIGKLYQSSGAALANGLSPKFFSLVLRTVSKELPEELSTRYGGVVQGDL